MSQRGDRPASAAAAQTLPRSPALLRAIAGNYREALAHHLHAFDQLAQCYLVLVNALPRSAARETLLVDIAFARMAIQATWTKVSVDADELREAPAPVSSHASDRVIDWPNARNERRRARRRKR